MVIDAVLGLSANGQLSTISPCPRPLDRWWTAGPTRFGPRGGSANIALGQSRVIGTGEGRVVGAGAAEREPEADKVGGAGLWKRGRLESGLVVLSFLICSGAGCRDWQLRDRAFHRPPISRQRSWARKLRPGPASTANRASNSTTVSTTSPRVRSSPWVGLVLTGGGVREGLAAARDREYRPSTRGTGPD